MTERARPMSGLSIADGMVAWLDSAIAPAGLYAMSLEGGEVINLTPDNCLCYAYPHLAGRHVVFHSWQTGPDDIWVVNIDTIEQRNLTDHLYPQTDPDFDGQWVVWTDLRNADEGDPFGGMNSSDIYGMAFPDGELQPFCTHSATQQYPAVGDGLVAWQDLRNADDPLNPAARDANFDIYLYEIATGREVRATNLPGGERRPQIDGRRLFFVADDDDGDAAVFMIDIDEAGMLD